MNHVIEEELEPLEDDEEEKNLKIFPEKLKILRMFYHRYTIRLKQANFRY
jgi:hypothetical protein